jgi:hypothetical protein
MSQSTSQPPARPASAAASRQTLQNINAKSLKSIGNTLNKEKIISRTPSTKLIATPRVQALKELSPSTLGSIQEKENKPSLAKTSNARLKTPATSKRPVAVSASTKERAVPLAKRPTSSASIQSSRKASAAQPQNYSEPLKEWELHSQLLQWKYLEHIAKQAFQNLQRHADHDIHKAYLKVSNLEKELDLMENDFIQEDEMKDNVTRLEELDKQLELLDDKLNHPGLLEDYVDFVEALDYEINSLNLNGASFSDLGISSYRIVMRNFNKNGEYRSTCE